MSVKKCKLTCRKKTIYSYDILYLYCTRCCKNILKKQIYLEKKIYEPLKALKVDNNLNSLINHRNKDHHFQFNKTSIIKKVQNKLNPLCTEYNNFKILNN